MDKFFTTFTLLTRMSMYLLAAAFFIWRGELFAVLGGGLTITVRMMCGLMAILILLVGFIHTSELHRSTQMD